MQTDFLLVRYETTEYSNDCWGGRESYTYTHYGEFKDIHDWLKFKAKNSSIKFRAFYICNKKVEEE